MRRTLSKAVCASAVFVTALLGAAASAQMETEKPSVVQGAQSVKVVPIKVHSIAVEGNLEGNAADREVLVFLPPSYENERQRRYPVVYALHGYSIGAEQWSHEIRAPQTIEDAFALGAQEMIVVLPDWKILHNGSMYSGSVTTGDFERFIARDLITCIDAHYRTIPERSRNREAARASQDSGGLCQVAVLGACSTRGCRGVVTESEQPSVAPRSSVAERRGSVRTVCEPTPRSCMTYSMPIESRTRSRCIRVRTPAGWAIVFRITSCRSSVAIFASKPAAADAVTRTEILAGVDHALHDFNQQAIAFIDDTHEQGPNKTIMRSSHGGAPPVRASVTRA